MDDIYESLDFRFEEDRLNSFDGWPLTYLTPNTMAAAGFYYLKKEDYVRAFCCGIIVHEWLENEDPLADHMKWSPNCRFVKNRTTEGQDEHNECEEENANMKYGINTLEKLDTLGVRKVKKAKFPEYANIAARFESYAKRNWPRMMRNKIKPLCEAGFYYTGQGDSVLCFHCGGGLQSWNEEDDPWIEHAKHFSKCYFLHLIKGEKFVAEAVKSRNDSTVIGENNEVTTEMQLPNSGDTKSESSDDDNRSTCIICCQEKNNILFLPCRHLVVCGTCSSSLIPGNYCPMCRQMIKATIRVFQ